MYNTVLNGCGLAKSKAHTDRCLQLMEKHGVHKDEMSYVELIKVFSHTYTTTNFLTLIAPMCTICMLTTVSCWLQMLKTSEEFVLLVWGSFQVSCVTQRQRCIGGMSSLRMGHQVHHPIAPWLLLSVGPMHFQRHCRPFRRCPMSFQIIGPSIFCQERSEDLPLSKPLICCLFH